MTASLPLAVTMGEPAGVGGELCLKAWQVRQPASRPFFVLDDPDRLGALARNLHLDVPVKEIARTEGQVLPSGYNQLVQHLEGGLVHAILVHEGDFVQKDQLLVQLDGAGLTMAPLERG